MGVVAYLCYQLLHLVTGAAWISCIVAIIVGAGVYFIMMVVIGGISKEDLQRFPGGGILIGMANRFGLLM